LQKAKEANFFNFDDFDYEEYEHYEKVQVKKVKYFFKDCVSLSFIPEDSGSNLLEQRKCLLNVFLL
jgi:hypothetical protein